MTKQEIIDRVSELVQDRSAVMLALIGNWVDLVLYDISSRGYLTSLKDEDNSVSLVADQRSYTIPSSTDQVYKVYVPDWGIDGFLTSVNDVVFQRMIHSDGTTFSGRPQWYNILESVNLRVHPLPNLTNAPTSPTTIQKLHVLRYKDITQPTSTSFTISEIKPKHILTIIYGCYTFGARFDALGDLPQAFLQYERGVARLIGDSRRLLHRPRQTAYNDF